MDTTKKMHKLLIVETKGYGLVPTSVMEDGRISLGAKGLYAYFICKTGGGVSCFPSNQTIMGALGIKSKITLNNYKSELESAKYLRIEERTYKSGRIASNNYFPAKLKSNKIVEEKEELDNSW